MNDLGVADGSTLAVIAALGFQVEIACLREMIANWVAECDGAARRVGVPVPGGLQILPTLDGLLLLLRRPAMDRFRSKS
jgi:hypothetical protein